MKKNNLLKTAMALVLVVATCITSIPVSAKGSVSVENKSMTLCKGEIRSVVIKGETYRDYRSYGRIIKHGNKMKHSYSYKSSNSKIASVTKKGVVKGKKPGKTTITVRSGNRTAKVKVTVKNKDIYLKNEDFKLPGSFKCRLGGKKTFTDLIKAGEAVYKKWNDVLMVTVTSSENKENYGEYDTIYDKPTNRGIKYGDTKKDVLKAYKGVKYYEYYRDKKVSWDKKGMWEMLFLNDMDADYHHALVFMGKPVYSKTQKGDDDPGTCTPLMSQALVFYFNKNGKLIEISYNVRHGMYVGPTLEQYCFLDDYYFDLLNIKRG
ncbi:MAG: Ig-like domain-containing protein [Lachnospiraceae bacterium]|nr:Ig-like domain-containing protein [Lachnospiraceae bacterium]